jgi:hypothetical protein
MPPELFVVRFPPSVARVHALKTRQHPSQTPRVLSQAASGQPFTFFCQLDKRAPAGISPCSRYFHRAISSLRAKATTPILRLRPLPMPKRRWYQRDSSLSGCQRSQHQASSTRSRRSRRLPALLMPC